MSMQAVRISCATALRAASEDSVMNGPKSMTGMLVTASRSMPSRASLAWNRSSKSPYSATASSFTSSTMFRSLQQEGLRRIDGEPKAHLAVGLGRHLPVQRHVRGGGMDVAECLAHAVGFVQSVRAGRTVQPVDRREAQLRREGLVAPVAGARFER